MTENARTKRTPLEKVMDPHGIAKGAYAKTLRIPLEDNKVPRGIKAVFIVVEACLPKKSMAANRGKVAYHDTKLQLQSEHGNK